MTRKLALAAYVRGEQPFARKLEDVLTHPPLELIVPHEGVIKHEAVGPLRVIATGVPE